MGNHLERITHLSYSELPTGDPSTGDPSGLEKEELRVGVAYFFSDEEEEVDDGGGGGVGYSMTPCHSQESPGPTCELEYSAFCSQECIFSKLRENQDMTVYSAKTLLSMCKPGDLVEILSNSQAPHWAVYEHDDQVIHLHQGQIRKDRLTEIGQGRHGRIVNSRYRFRPLPADLVVQNAAGHLGLNTGDICWTNSESFAAWCRFGKREFKAGGEAHSAEQQYFLKVHLGAGGSCGGRGHTLVFRSLEDMIRERRRVDASGAVFRSQ
ncbi:hypothetical protein DPEC_G00081270 [Dallia pectoralis]|uniref:Uncharacterized protein n=1 Tax=Dallia pectoralis TaxID=75939 RepID=A0ACC2GY89_DALPE|nr:hypothetical protein DPEC_G00081270 [Dallia pectoralis]